MPDTMPNGTPAADVAAGQQPTVTDGSTLTTNVNQQQPTSTPDNAASGQQSTDGQQQSPEVSNPAAQKAAQEAARYRTELRTAQARLAEFEAAQRAAEEAQMSDLQKAQRQIAEFQTREAQQQLELQTLRLERAIQQHAVRLGVVDLDAAVKLLDTSALDYDEAGMPTNTEAVLTAMLEQRPWLRGQQSSAQAAPQAPQVGATNPSRPGGPITISAAQYSDPAFKAQYMRDYGEDLLSAMNKGKVKLV